MAYSIHQAAEKTGITINALRYYDREGLLPFLVKKPSGIRIFNDGDIEKLRVLVCLKTIGMEIKDIKEYMQLWELGENTLNARQRTFQERADATKQQITALENAIEMMNRMLLQEETKAKDGAK